MTGVPPPNQQQQPGQGGQQQPAPGAQQQQQGLPPTALPQQLASLNSFYGAVGSSRGGFNPRQQQFGMASHLADGGELEQDHEQDHEFGSTSLDAMARNLATRYGMPIGRGRLVDDQGNFLMTPQQIADASGGSVSLGEAAAQMNYIGQAIAKQQNEQQQQKGIAALQAGLGQVQSRGRGSLAGMMSGYYQDIADLYANQEYEAADFSYYVQKEQLDIQRELQSRAERLAKKQARGQFVAGLGITVASIFTGNVAGITAGASMAGGAAGSTGWF